MSDEITVTAALRCSNGDFRLDVNPGSVQIDQAIAAGGNPGTVSIGTVDTAISFTGLTTPGYVWMRNLDGTNYVDIGPDSGGTMVPCLRLKAGEVALFRLSAGVTLKGKAHTAACLVQIHALDS